MALNAGALAAQMATGIGQTQVTSQLMGLASGIISEITSNGVAAVGSPSGNKISGVSGSSMANKVATDAGFGSTSAQLASFCDGIATHILSSAEVSYTGPTPPATPVYYLGGTISGLSGPTMAALIVSNVGYPSLSSQLLGMCNAIASYIMSNAVVTSGTIS